MKEEGHFSARGKTGRNIWPEGKKKKITRTFREGKDSEGERFPDGGNLGKKDVRGKGYRRNFYQRKELAEKESQTSRQGKNSAQSIGTIFSIGGILQTSKIG